jgi:hypothetical protein
MAGSPEAERSARFVIISLWDLPSPPHALYTIPEELSRFD